MIVKNLRNSREDRELTETDIAEILDVDNSTVSGWETEKDVIPMERLIQYANKLEYSLDYLYGLSDENNFKPIKIDKKRIGENLKNLRKINKMTQAEVVNKIGSGQPAYSHYERGRTLPSTLVLFGLTKIYKPFSIDKDIFDDNNNYSK